MMSSTSMAALCLTLAVLAGLHVPVHAQQTIAFSDISSECVDPSGFQQCWSNVTSTAQSCYSAVNKCSGSGTCTDENTCSSTKPDCVANCVCDAYAGWLNCALSSCWNKIYSCEYQNLALKAHANCPAAGVGPANTELADNYLPYVPTPAGAPGGCSCDLTFVYYRHYRWDVDGRACLARLNATSASGTTADQCVCCAASEKVSNYYATCPSTDPADVPFWSTTIAADLETLLSPTCQSAIGSGAVDCRKLGFAKPGLTGSGSFYYNASALPANGTQSLSNTGNSITSPVAGPTLVWQLGAKFPNMTAVAASVTATGGTGTSSASASATGSTGGAVSVRGAGSGAVQQLMLVLGMMAVGMALL